MSRLYLDHAAATPLRPEVREAIAPFLDGVAGNPSSVHGWGRRAAEQLDDARIRVADVLGVRAREIIFVRGGTESVNLAVLGRADWAQSQRMSGWVMYRSAVEHSAVTESMDAVAADTGDATIETFRVSPDGAVDPIADLAFGARNTVLVSCQWVNHETGLVLPVEKLSDHCAAEGVAFHIDATQAGGLLSGRTSHHSRTLLSISGHKLGGPRSTGVLVVPMDTEIRPRLFGGGQERGLRPGTGDVAGAVGLATALEAVVVKYPFERKRLTELRDRLQTGLQHRIPDLRVHGIEGPRAPHILSLGIQGVPRDLLPGAMDVEGIGTSAGSACRSGSTEPSPVLAALYGSAARRVAPLRLSLGWSTTDTEIDEAIHRIPPIVERVRSLGVAG